MIFNASTKQEIVKKYKHRMARQTCVNSTLESDGARRTAKENTEKTSYEHTALRAKEI